MNPTTQIRLSLRLCAHLEDLAGLHYLETRELLVLTDALVAWIQMQQAYLVPRVRTPPSVRLADARTCWLEERRAAQTRVWVKQAGQTPRTLTHVPLFCPWGFGTDRLAVRDTALAILADDLGESLSRGTFVHRQGHACQWYPALLSTLQQRGSNGSINSSEIAALLEHTCQRPS